MTPPPSRPVCLARARRLRAARRLVAARPALVAELKTLSRADQRHTSAQNDNYIHLLRIA
jgi:hypothetical protein